MCCWRVKTDVGKLLVPTDALGAVSSTLVGKSIKNYIQGINQCIVYLGCRVVVEDKMQVNTLAALVPIACLGYLESQ